MPLLPDINLGANLTDDPKEMLKSLERQINEWGRLISNENVTRVMKGDQAGDQNIIIGELEDGTQGIQLTDGTITTTIKPESFVQNDGTNDRIFLGNE